MWEKEKKEKKKNIYILRHCYNGPPQAVKNKTKDSNTECEIE